jgi:hypothetical protein
MDAEFGSAGGFAVLLNKHSEDEESGNAKANLKLVGSIVTKVGVVRLHYNVA